MTTFTGPCPHCGSVAEREPYNIGSGPELACSSCEWCWGALGQPLKPLGYDLNDLPDEPIGAPP